MARTHKPLAALEDWKTRLATARLTLKTLEVGELRVIQAVVQLLPHLDSLTQKGRWHNAWVGRVADLELITAIEAVAQAEQKKAEAAKARLSRQRMKPPVATP